MRELLEVRGPKPFIAARIKLPSSENTLAQIRALQAIEGFEFICPNQPLQTGDFPNEGQGQFIKQWHLHNTGQDPPGGSEDADVDAPEGWIWEKGDHPNDLIRVAILDSGIPIDAEGIGLSHEDLNDPQRFTLCLDVVGEGIPFRDRRGHGTHVTGIVSAETNNSVGVAGVAWKNKAMVYRILNQWGTGNWWDTFVAIDHAIENGAKVINQSSGEPNLNWYLRIMLGNLIEKAHIYGIVYVTIAGNHPNYACNTAMWYPGAFGSEYANLITVAATDKNDLRARYSIVGPEITVAAPGGGGWDWPENNGIYSTTPGYPVTMEMFHSDKYGYCSGTSMSAPTVTGLVALVRSINPSLWPSYVIGLITENADPVHAEEIDPYCEIEYDYTGDGHNNLVGYGRINIEETLRSVPLTGFHAEIVPINGGGPNKVIATNRPPQTWYAHLSWSTHRCDFFWRYRVDKSENEPGNWHFVRYPDQPQYGEFQMCDDYAVEDWVDYYYRVSVVNEADSIIVSSPVIHVYAGGDPLRSPAMDNIPTTLTLIHNYPNPFNPTTQIKFGLPKASHIRLQIMNVRGQTIRVLVDEQRAAGWYTVTWDSKNEAGRDVASGIYLYLIEADNKKILKKMTLIR